VYEPIWRPLPRRVGFNIGTTSEGLEVSLSLENGVYSADRIGGKSDVLISREERDDGAVRIESKEPVVCD